MSLPTGATSLSTAIQLAYQAKYTATNDSERIKHLTEAVYMMIQIMEDHIIENQENTIRRAKSSGRQQM
jgi:hypothetical protein